MSQGNSTFEKHWKIRELAERWHISRERVRLLVKDFPGVIRLAGPSGDHVTYVIPESVAVELYETLKQRG